MTAAGGDAGARLYVYFKVPAPSCADVVAAVRALQSALCRRHPGLQADLLQREEDAGQVTLMEVYQRSGAGVGAAVAEDLAASVRKASPEALRAATRHVEVFRPCA